MSNEIFYAIDMGAPSGRYSGFFCWRYDPQTGELSSFDGKNGGWNESLESIKKDSANFKVHLTIEAALWGMKDDKDNWIVRFSLLSHPHYTERPWYSGAGASTGLMAQEYLHQLKNSYAKSITVRESYISGLKYNKKQKRGEKKDHPKPENSIIEGLLSKLSRSHADDALEGLLLTIEEVRGSLNNLKFNIGNKDISVSQWINWPQSKTQVINLNKHGFPFGVGILGANSIFDFELGKILFTKREFTDLKP